MATITAVAGNTSFSVSGNSSPTGIDTPTIATANLSNAQVGNGPSTNILDMGGSIGPALLRVTTAVGGGPTCTYAIEGSPDTVNWFAIQYADSASPQTLVITTFVITTAGTAIKLLPPNLPVRYVRMTYSANTNVTNTVDIYVY